MLAVGFPWWFRGKESALQCTRNESESLVWEDFLCCEATKPVHQTTEHDLESDYWSPHALEPTLCNKRSHYNEKPLALAPQRGSSPCLLQLEKACAQQQRLNTDNK